MTKNELLAEVRRLSYIVDSIPDGIWKEMIRHEQQMGLDGSLEIFKMSVNDDGSLNSQPKGTD